MPNPYSMQIRFVSDGAGAVLKDFDAIGTAGQVTKSRIAGSYTGDVIPENVVRNFSTPAAATSLVYAKQLRDIGVGAREAGEGLAVGSRQAIFMTGSLARLGETGQMSIGSLVREGVYAKMILGGVGAAGTAAFIGVAAAAVATGIVIKHDIDVIKETANAWKEAGASAQGYGAVVAQALHLIDAPHVSGNALRFTDSLRAAGREQFAKNTLEDFTREKNPVDETLKWAAANKGVAYTHQQIITHYKEEVVLAEMLAKTTEHQKRIEESYTPEHQRELREQAAREEEKVLESQFTSARLGRLRGKDDLAAETVVHEVMRGTFEKEKGATNEEKIASVEGRVERQLEQIRKAAERTSSAEQDAASKFRQAAEKPQFATADEAGSVGAYRATLMHGSEANEMKKIAEQQLATAVKQATSLETLVQRAVHIAVVALDNS